MARAGIRSGFFPRLVGLLFQRKLGEEDGLFFERCGQGRLGAAIHTVGLRFEIGVVWLDADLRVVDMRLAKPWRFAHVPKAPAMYYLEANPAILELARIGDQLRIDEVPA